MTSKVFTPTYLYIKPHQVTGKLYFGKTIRNPEQYKGSGLRWQSHLKKHGRTVDNLWYCLFTERESLVDFALKCPESLDISSIASDIFIYYNHRN